ncbi:hypothetical protein ACIRJR_09465 [Streptomyces sp. NPDC102402]|uniref:hypothetical protein n=1 Tax=Streptomyces sp. NPDC102402 TaxID=3366169 RepID=UPI00380D66AE
MARKQEQPAEGRVVLGREQRAAREQDRQDYRAAEDRRQEESNRRPFLGLG